MRRLLSIGLVIVAGISAGCGLNDVASGGLAVAAARTQTTTYPSDLLVYAQEWSLWPSRTRIPAGTIDVELWNRGQDAHDLRVRRVNAHGMMVGPVLGGVSVTPSGDLHKGVWKLAAGTYEIYCSMPGHLAMGMHTLISVTGRARR